MSSVHGTLTFSNVSVREMARIAAALDTIGQCYAMYFYGWSATRKGEICATQTGWHQIFVPEKTTERRQFFEASIDGQRLLVKPEHGIFQGLKVVFE